MINKMVGIKLIFIFRLSENESHFAKNPMKGGSPAKFITMNKEVSFLSGFNRDSKEVAFTFETTKMMNRTEIQYKVKNRKNTLVLTKTLRMIQPRLKIEDQARISFKSFLLNIEIAPIATEEIMKKEARYFSWNKTKYRGAIFCHVKSTRLVFHLELFETLINHQ
jgi:hypothetical protein